MTYTANELCQIQVLSPWISVPKRGITAQLLFHYADALLWRLLESEKLEASSTENRFIHKKVIIWFLRFVPEWRTCMNQGLSATSWWTYLFRPITSVCFQYFPNQRNEHFSLWYFTSPTKKTYISLCITIMSILEAQYYQWNHFLPCCNIWWLNHSKI